jgi:hypothetical protein
MYNPDTDLLFPPRAIHALTTERGEVWQKLVLAVEEAGQDSPAETAFILMMARMNACSTCNADSFRAMNGCTACARQSLKRFRGPDDQLEETFQSARGEVDQYIQKKGNYA